MTTPAAESSAPTAARMVIGGEAVEAVDGQTFEVVNPATGSVIATAPQGGPADVELAVQAAQRAFEDRQGWATWAAARRGRALARLATLIKDHADELAGLESRNVGKPISGARGRSPGPAWSSSTTPAPPTRSSARRSPVSKPGLDYTLRKPLGVCAAIVPWNAPWVILAAKVAPALATGNTIVVKPASYTPLSALAMAGLALEVGIPPGVLNVVTGPGGSSGTPWSKTRVAFVGFTGETETGAGDHAPAARRR